MNVINECMKKVLLLGNSAGTHCIGEILKKAGCELFTYGVAKNIGLADLAEESKVGDWDDVEVIRSYAARVKPDFAFIGSTQPIERGLAVALLELGIPSIAPTKKLSVLEFSKSFTRSLLKKYDVRGNPDFRVFYGEEGIEEYMKQLNGEYVVKADGLVMHGIGVQVSGEHLPDIASGAAFAKKALAEFGRVVIEEKMIGQEFSLMFFCDGKKLVKMPAVQDHKRAFEGDRGPNTGGMGSYSDVDGSLPFLRKSDLEEAERISYEVLAAFEKEMGEPYKGILYGGFMATAKGLQLMEYNVRVGDPEVINVFPLLRGNLIEICEAILHGHLDQLNIDFEKKATVCKYIVPEGFPDTHMEGQKIQLGNLPSNVQAYYAGVDRSDDQLVLSSLRAVALLGIGDTLQDAEKFSENACEQVQGPVHWRRDIGTQTLIQKRVALMEQLRS